MDAQSRARTSIEHRIERLYKKATFVPVEVSAQLIIVDRHRENLDANYDSLIKRASDDSLESLFERYSTYAEYLDEN